MTTVTVLEKHNENTTRYITATFLNKDESEEAPASARYRIDNVTNDSVVLAWTAIATPAAIEEIVITPAQNAIVTPANPQEVIEVTVEGTYSASDKVTNKIQYILLNLTYYP